MNYRRAAEWSPGDENWSLADVVIDNLAAIEIADRIGLCVAVDFKSYDERSVIPLCVGSGHECRFVHGANGVSWEELSESGRNFLAGADRIVQGFVGGAFDGWPNTLTSEKEG